MTSVYNALLRRQVQYPLSRWCAAFVGLLVVGTSSGHAQQVDVCVNFAGSGIGAADQGAFLAKVQAHYTAIGLGPGAAQRVIFKNAGPPAPAGGCDLRVCFINDETKKWHGIAHKNRHTCIVNRFYIDKKFPVPPAGNTARRCAALAETMAHEVGHLLCAVHDCKGQGKKKVAGVPGLQPCGGAPSIMTVGQCVTCANRGAGTRLFTNLSKQQIRVGVIRWSQGKRKWGLVARFDENALCLVEGISHLEILEDPDNPGEELVQEDPDVTFSYSLTGDAGFDFGWLNDEGEFQEAMPVTLPPDDPDFPNEPVNPDQLLQTRGGAFMNFAIRDQATGDIFNQIQHGSVSFSGVVNLGSAAALPELSSNYSSEATVEIPPVTIFLDTGDWGDENGFCQIATPPTTGACSIAVGVCSRLTQAECEAFAPAGSFAGEGTSCEEFVIPAVSDWGLAVLGLLTLAAGLVAIRPGRLLRAHA